jgi:hypothetical protein
MMTMVHDGEQLDLPAILEAWTPRLAIRKTVERKPDGPSVA